MGKRKPDRKYAVTKRNFNSTRRKFQNDENLPGKSPSDPPPQKLRKMSKTEPEPLFYPPEPIHPPIPKDGLVSLEK